MSELGTLLEREMQEIGPAGYTIADVAHRRDRRSRNRRIRAAVVALVIAGAAVGGILQAFKHIPSNVPAQQGLVHNGRIAFVNPGESGPEDRLYTVGPDGRDLRKLADIHAEYPDWSPDGSMVAFDDGSVVAIHDWSKSEGHIYTVKADGTGLTPLTSGEGSEFTPDWSPDGAHIAFTALGAHVALTAHSQKGLPPGIFILDPATGAMQQVTANPYGYQDKEPDYAPDGIQIAFVRDRQLIEAGDPSDRSALFVVNVDGSGLRRLTPWRMGVTRTPSWSPDGTTIVFRGDSDAKGEPSQIFKIRSDGSRLRQLTFETNAESYWPSWSPDGTRIVFTRYVQTATFQRIYTMSPDGSGLAPVTQEIPGQNEASWGTHP